jgi:hypothetical protein
MSIILSDERSEESKAPYSYDDLGAPSLSPVFAESVGSVQST